MSKTTQPFTHRCVVDEEEEHSIMFSNTGKLIVHTGIPGQVVTLTRARKPMSSAQTEVLIHSLTHSLTHTHTLGSPYRHVDVSAAQQNATAHIPQALQLETPRVTISLGETAML